MAKAHQPLSPSSDRSKRAAAPLTVDQAAGVIVGLINARRHSPRHDDIAAVIARTVGTSAAAATEVSDLGLKIRHVIQDIAANDAELDELPEDSAQYRACQARIDAGFARLDELTAQLPHTPRTLADLLTIAEVAYYWWDKDRNPDGTLSALDDNVCPDDHWAARLILAVVTMGGRHHA
jgi:uncharacterized membrane protein YccC